MLLEAYDVRHEAPELTLVRDRDVGLLQIAVAPSLSLIEAKSASASGSAIQLVGMEDTALQSELPGPVTTPNARRSI